MVMHLWAMLLPKGGAVILSRFLGSWRGKLLRQAYAGLYRWDQKDKRYALDTDPFKKCPGVTVLDTLRAFAEDHGLREHTYFGAEVAKIEKSDEG